MKKDFTIMSTKSKLSFFNEKNQMPGQIELIIRLNGGHCLISGRARWAATECS
ncbi:MAG: hypothetical protein ACYTFK_04420 [Planctomycetota bacterium]|jgi:hypothetical protein